MNYRVSVLFLALLLVFPISLAQEAFEPDRILSNSERWQDVYSVTQYGSLAGITTQFLVSNRHSTLILNAIPESTDLQVFSSESVPYVLGYEGFLRARGYEAEEVESDQLNLELASRLPDITNFIVIDDAYGYNAIAVAPYAIRSRSFVLFANEDTIDDVTDFLATRTVNDVLIYGQVDREVIAELDQYNPEIINNNGDRFRNNVDIVKKYMETGQAKQVILTNGEFIEAEIMDGSEPVIFIGTNNVPEVIRDYVQNSDIEVGVLIGNELVGTATFVRRELGISVFVKFAQGARQRTNSISQVEALDMFYLPVFDLNLELDNVKYNRATNRLELTIRNTVEQSIYFSGTYSLTGADDSRQTVGDEEPNFIDGGELRTLVYELEPFPEGDISGDIFIIYGESPGSMEKEIRETLAIESITVLDDCEITSLDDLQLNLRRKEFSILAENEGTVACYVDLELVDLEVAGQKNSYAMEDVELIDAESKKRLKIRVEDFEEEDLEDNERIKVRALYGERENALIKILEGTFELSVKKGDTVSYILLLIIVVLFFLILWRRKKKKEEEKGVHKVHK